MQNLNTENWREEIPHFPDCAWLARPYNQCNCQRSTFIAVTQRLLQAQAREIIEEADLAYNHAWDLSYYEPDFRGVVNQLKSRYLREGEGDV